ncbi:MAG: alpha-glucan family phosphorylase [Aggregatilineales bacterium]
MVRPVATINVVPKLPKPLGRLQDLAYNLRWSWDFESISLFRRIDPDLWVKTRSNPVWMLGLVSQERLEACANDRSFMAHYQRVCDAFDEYMTSKTTWYQNTYGKNKKQPVIAYFSMEFGLTECLQNYSGGLGVLSGDHLKSASDLGLPLVGVGLLYQEGYFQQYLNTDGYQQESYPINDYANLPVTLQRDKDGNPIKISVPMPGRELYAQIWKVQVGRISLYLLDSNIGDNPRVDDRNLTDRLYGGDRRTRIRQEVLMGIGGIRALEALGLRPTICHMNEGHSAFLGLERIRQLMNENNLSFDQARQIAKTGTVYTTHTPVPAGLERFGFDLIDEHFTNYWGLLGLNREQFVNLGRENMGTYELFSMSVLALNLSSAANGVAQLHGVVSREMWNWVYPGVPEHEVPVGAVTNGIHMETWVSGEMASLFDRYLSPDWRNDETDVEIWKDVDNIPDSEMWRTHERRRERLVAFARRQLQAQLKSRGASQLEIDAAEEVLNPDALTIGFARRFATYKRATLIMRDIERLKALLSDADRPVQFIFAGKAHPHDEGGKALIREIVKVAEMPEFRRKIVFLENYDMLVARYMVRGVDVWLNTPRRPKEASGTSGMKVIYNGGLNCSILDGWWAEGYSPDVGWAIGNGEQYEEEQWEHQDEIESKALYTVLENDLIPLFYNRSADSLPRHWIEKVKNSMKKLAPFFNTRRMVREYAVDYYMPVAERYMNMTSPNVENALSYVSWRSSLDNLWKTVHIDDVNVNKTQITVGSQIDVSARINLGSLTPNDVLVQVYYGPLDTRGNINETGQTADMKPEGERNSDGTYTFAVKVKYPTSGECGVSVRVLPHHEYLSTSFQPGLITWA